MSTQQATDQRFELELRLLGYVPGSSTIICQLCKTPKGGCSTEAVACRDCIYPLLGLPV